jgi:hypothetical protein
MDSAGQHPRFLGKEDLFVSQFQHMYLFKTFPVPPQKISVPECERIQYNKFGFPVWEQFALASCVTPGGTPAQLLIFPLLNGILPVPYISTTDLNKPTISAASVIGSYDCRDGDSENLNDIYRWLSNSLDVWQTVMRSYNQQTLSLFSINEIIGTFHLRHIIRFCLDLYKGIFKELTTVPDNESDNCFIFHVRYLACQNSYIVWRDLLEKQMGDGEKADLWKSARDATATLLLDGPSISFLKWLLCRVRIADSS